MITAGLIRQHIQKLPAGEPFTPAAFLGMGARVRRSGAVPPRQDCAITRVTRGVFVRPTESRHLGKVLPESRKVAEAVAKAKGASIQVHGAEAARRFELTTQTPTQPVFYTRGPSKQFWMGKMEVVLKHAASHKLAFPGACWRRHSIHSRRRRMDIQFMACLSVREDDDHASLEMG